MFRPVADSDSGKALELRGILHTLLEQPKEGLEDLARVRFEGTADAEYYLHKAMCQLQLKEQQEAVRTLNDGLVHHPEDRNLIKERSYLPLRLRL